MIPLPRALPANLASLSSTRLAPWPLRDLPRGHALLFTQAMAGGRRASSAAQTPQPEQQPQPDAATADAANAVAAAEQQEALARQAAFDAASQEVKGFVNQLLQGDPWALSVISKAAEAAGSVDASTQTDVLSFKLADRKTIGEIESNWDPSTGTFKDQEAGKQRGISLQIAPA